MVCRWQVEIDDYANRVLAKHWPNVRRWPDVRTWPQPDTERVDVICGGFPCKQTSNGAAIHGRRNGLAGSDSGLWFEMLRVVRLLKPQCVVVENVGGAGTWKDTITRGLADAGYQVPADPLSVSAASLGAPHSRRRLFWIADIDGKGLEITRQAGPSPDETHERRATSGNRWIATLPGIRGMDDGISDRLDRRSRIERCGNAVVPQVAEFIGRRIVEALAAPSHEAPDATHLLPVVQE